VENQQMNFQTSQSKDTLSSLPPPQDFSLVLGGPLFQLLRRAHLSDDALMLVRQRVIVVSLLAWLPLLVLATLEGQVLSGSATVPFLHDIEVHVRFLVALPLLIAAELVVHQRMRSVVNVFQERNLIPKSAMTQFDAAIASAFRLRNSVLAEVLLIGLVYVFGIMIMWRHYLVLDTSTWYSTMSADRSTLSFAGVWYGYVSLPIFQFLLCRWYFRLFIWMRFLWKVSRIELSLIPTHPDRVGGLGFLAESIYAFALLAVAHGVLLAGLLANRILFLGAALTDYKIEMVIVLLFVLCVVVGPLLVFAPQLAQARRTGLREYGTLAERYVRQFDSKWLRDTSSDASLVGSTDIQALADLNNSHEIVRTMRAAPVTKQAVMQIVIATLAPLAPLTLTLMPLETLLQTLLGVLF
jgi:hypothetical protein